MAVFADAGFSQGVQNWNERQRKRRSEVAGLFEEFKRNNPYATAEDYNQYIETIVGPGELYLRGNLPAGDILKRMEADNLRKKAMDDRRAAIEMAASDLALKNQLQEMASRMILSHNDDEIIDALTQATAQPGTDEYAVQRETIRGLVGNLQQQRDLKMDEVYRQVLDESLKMIERTEGEISMDDLMSGFRTRFPNMNLAGVKNLEKKLKDVAKFEFDKKKEDQEIKRQARKQELLLKIMGNEVLARKMTAGTEQRADAEAMIHNLMRTAGFSAEKDPDVLEEIMRELTGTQSLLHDAERKNTVEKYTTAQQAALEARHEMQGDILGARASTMNDEQGGVLTEVHSQYLMPAALLDRLTAWVDNKQYSSPLSAASEFIEALGPNERALLVPRGEFATRAKQTAESLAPVSQTAEQYVEQSSAAFRELETAGNQEIKRLMGLAQKASDVGSPDEILSVLQNVKAAKQWLAANIKDIEQQMKVALNTRERWQKGNTAFTQNEVDNVLMPQLMEREKQLTSMLNDLETSLASEHKRISAKLEQERALRAQQQEEREAYLSRNSLPPDNHPIRQRRF